MYIPRTRNNVDNQANVNMHASMPIKEINRRNLVHSRDLRRWPHPVSPSFSDPARPSPCSILMYEDDEIGARWLAVGVLPIQGLHAGLVNTPPSQDSRMQSDVRGWGGGTVV